MFQYIWQLLSIGKFLLFAVLSPTFENFNWYIAKVTYSIKEWFSKNLETYTPARAPVIKLRLCSCKSRCDSFLFNNSLDVKILKLYKEQLLSYTMEYGIAAANGDTKPLNRAREPSSLTVVFKHCIIPNFSCDICMRTYIIIYLSTCS